MRDADVTHDDLVLDLGAGEGALTVELAKQAGSVRAIEVDPSLCERLRRRFAGAPNVDVVCGDATRVPLPAERAAAYRALVDAAFARRAPIRRGLRGTVSPLELKRLGRDLGFSPDAPPWELDQHQWAGVFRFVRSRPIHSDGHEPL